MKNGEKEEFVWLPLQTNYNKELLIAQFLRERQIEFYIPMMYELQNSGTDTSHCEHVLVPAIQIYFLCIIFMTKTGVSVL